MELGHLVHAPLVSLRDRIDGLWRRLPGWARAALAEPATHFVLLGLVLFATAGAWRAAERPEIRISAAEVGRLAAYWRLQAQRDPTPRELAALVQERVDEEILYQEALRLGLDRDDVIVRRRLAQKLSFLNQDLLQPPEPTPAQLQAWYDNHRADFATPGKVTFEHLYFSAQAGPDRAEASARAALAALGRDGEAAATLGDPFMLPLGFADAPLATVRRDFGEAFAGALVSAPTGRWIGPVRSAYGVHLVRVAARTGSGVAPFDAVVGQVRQAWIADRRRIANERWLAGLRRRYPVSVEGRAGAAE
ncbi:MAG: peptidyl-prolyl cis-trans isomerase [Pseudomonadota bacterium]